jgi:hypothetical protein
MADLAAAELGLNLHLAALLHQAKVMRVVMLFLVATLAEAAAVRVQLVLMQPLQSEEVAV